MATYRDLLGSTFENKFTMNKFQEFIVQFFNNSKIVDPNNKRQDYWNWNEYSYYVNGFFHVADYTDPNKQKVAIFAVELKKGKSLEKARSKQRNFIADRMKNLNYDGAITAFYSEDENEPKWRLSFVRLDYEFLKGKVKTNFTPAKRYSYLVGAGEPCHTAMQQLFPILEEEKFNPTIDKIEEAFSVEKVTKQFFEKYKEKYFELKDFLLSNKTFKEEAERCIKSENIEDIEKFTEQFSKKLMGQIAFMYFLQKKGWMGVKAIPQTITETQYKNLFYYSVLTKKFADKLYVKSNENEYKLVANTLKSLTADEELAVASSLKGQPWGTGPKDFVRRLFDVALESKQNYFEDYLEPLFYEALNEKRPANNYYARLHCRIPFLNGGLFEPYYDWQHNNFSIPNEIFSNKKDKGERDADGILDIFDRYNFTMNEDEPLEKEIAVDPEMLGKIFENLLDAKDRKSKGAFYTPREIVHYMCQESLVNYLVNTLNLPYSDTKDFILYGEIMKDEDCSREVKQGIANMLIPETIYSNLQAIDNALADVRVADPAVGSGAFPMGMVNEIVKARDIITEYRARNIEIEEKKKGTSDKQINFLKAKEHELRNLYVLKRDTMFNSIYAVDIEPSAVDIAKLRLWLSLVVEFEITADEPTPPTLPNLDCHILCGNSLIDEFEKVKLFDPNILSGSGDLISGLYESMFNKLYDAERKFFYAQNHEDKKQYREEIEKIKLSIMESALSGCTNDTKERFLQTRQMASKPYTLWQLEFSKVFKDKGGFDIVIGNPPYLEARNEGFSDEQKEILQHLLREKYGNKFDLIPRGSDLLIYFFELSLSIMKRTGINAFITQNSWLDTEYGFSFQKFLLSKTNILGIVDSDFKAFDTANINTVISFFEGNIGCTKEILFARCHKPFSNYYFPTQNYQKELSSNVTIKHFNKNDPLIMENKWGFIFNSDLEFIEIVKSLSKKGQKVGDIDWLSIGQGLNITKDYVITKANIPSILTKDDVIPYLNVDECGYYDWKTTETYIISNKTLSINTQKDIISMGYKIFDEKNSKRQKPALILPRGIGSKHFCSLNTNCGYSASCVDIYLNSKDKTKINNLWLFMNSTLFWLIREMSGRKSLGGGMLKAEAIDLKQFPIYFEFNKNKEIDSIIVETKDIRVENAIEEIKRKHHQQIDKIVFDELGFDGNTRQYITDLFVKKYSERVLKSKTK